MTNPIIPVFDGHNDLPWESRDNRHYSVEGIDQELPQTLHTDIPKLRRGGYLAQYWSAYVHSDYAGGDAVIGAATVILAMGAGKRAAAGIGEYLTQE